MTNCPYCDHTAGGTFCPNCGEKLIATKLDTFTILNGFFKSLVNLDKGILFVLKSMLLKPREFCLLYLQGKRKGILNPIGFVFISLTLFVLLNEWISDGGADRVSREFSDNSFRQQGYEAGLIIGGYLKYFWLFMILPLASSAKLIFRRYTFAEHIAISAFIFGLANFVGVVGYILFEIILVFNPLVYLIIFVSLIRVYRLMEGIVEIMILSFVVLMLFLIKMLMIIGVVIILV